MECIIHFIKEYWVQIVFLLGMIGSFYLYERTRIEAEKCSLRNDILDIYDKCKDKNKLLIIN